MEENRFRCHFSTIIENLGTAFWVIVVMLVSELDAFGEVLALLLKGQITFLEALAAMGIFFGIVAGVLVCNFMVWSKTWISIEKDAIVIERNLLNRKVNTIGMKNISNINLEQNIFERIMGTYKIKLDTNSATTADSTDVKIILSKEKAEQFKQQVMQHMQAEYEEIPEENVEYDVTYSAKDIILHCVYTASPVAVIIILAFLIGCAVALRFVDTGTIVLDSIVNVIGSVLAVAFVIWSVFQSLVRDFFVYYGFKARRQENKIYLSHGLFKKRQYTLAVDKINAVSMIAPTVSRICGRQYVKVYCVGVGDEENENSMLLLSEKKEGMQKKLSLLLPEFVIEEPKIIKREKVSLLSDAVEVFIWALLLGAIVVLLGLRNLAGIEDLWMRVVIVVVAVFIFLMTLLGVFLDFKTSGIGVGEEVLLNITGTYSKSMTWIPYSRIQKLQYTQHWLLRRFGLAVGVIQILAAALDSVHITSHFPVEVFEDIQEKMLRRKGRK